MTTDLLLSGCKANKQQNNTGKMGQHPLVVFIVTSLEDLSAFKTSVSHVNLKFQIIMQAISLLGISTKPPPTLSFLPLGTTKQTHADLKDLVNSSRQVTECAMSVISPPAPFSVISPPSNI